MEVPIPQAKPRLVRLGAFRVGVRPGPERPTVRDEILAVLPELVDGRNEFRMRDLMDRLNPYEDSRRRWAVEKALVRLCTEVTSTSGVTRTGAGRYRARRNSLIRS